jgi:hypothetical protein
MRKNILPIVVCLAAVAFTSCRAKPMTLDEYRTCREAFYAVYTHQGEDDFLIEVTRKGNPVKGIRDRAARICDSLGFTFDQFNRAHKRYGLEGLTYIQEVRLFDVIKRSDPTPGLFESDNYKIKLGYPLLVRKYISSQEAIELFLMDLGISPTKQLTIGKGGIRFDGFKVEPDSLPQIISRYKRTLWREFDDKETAEKIAGKYGGVPATDAPYRSGKYFYKFILPPLVHLKVEPGITCNDIWFVSNFLTDAKVEYLTVDDPRDEWSEITFRLVHEYPSDIQCLMDEWYYAGCVVPGPFVVTPEGDTQSLKNLARVVFSQNKEGYNHPNLLITAEKLPFDSLLLALSSMAYYRVTESDYIDFYLASPEVYELYKTKSLKWPESVKNH